AIRAIFFTGPRQVIDALEEKEPPKMSLQSALIIFSAPATRGSVHASGPVIGKDSSICGSRISGYSAWPQHGRAQQTRWKQHWKNRPSSPAAAATCKAWGGSLLARTAAWFMPRTVNTC